jgi:c-di-GMP-binding flagellar brake protein YcgR
MQTNVDDQNASSPPPDRRKHVRYRFSIPVTIRGADRTSISGISIEISESGMSAIAAQSLEINTTVQLEPVAAGSVSALVRRNTGRVYGFEFLNLTAEQSQRIIETCKMLPRYEGKGLGI